MSRPESEPCFVCQEPWRHCICAGHPTRAEREAEAAGEYAAESGLSITGGESQPIPILPVVSADEMPETVRRVVAQHLAEREEGYRLADTYFTICWLADDRERLLARSTWQPIATAPRDGTHILACDWSRADSRTTFNEQPPTVVHYYAHPGEEGFYTSVNELAPERTYKATHWMPLPAPPTEDTNASR